MEVFIVVSHGWSTATVHEAFYAREKAVEYIESSGRAHDMRIISKCII